MFSKELIALSLFLTYVQTLAPFRDCKSICANVRHTNEKSVFAQTFDDGPSDYTDTILDTLKLYNIKATFFLIGNQINSDKRRATLNRMYNEGHIIASHTYTHRDLTTLSDFEIIDEMEKTSQLIYEAIAVKPAYMRPPYGSINQRVENILTNLGYKIFIWNYATDDWAGYSCAQMMLNLKNYINGLSTNKSLLSLHHDNQRETMLCEDETIKFILEKNFKLVRLDECILDTESAIYQ